MKSLLVIACFLPTLVFADILPPPPASTNDVQAGTSTSKFISPWALANAGVNVGLSAAAVAAQIAATNANSATVYAGTAANANNWLPTNNLVTWQDGDLLILSNKVTGATNITQISTMNNTRSGSITAAGGFVGNATYATNSGTSAQASSVTNAAAIASETQYLTQNGTISSNWSVYLNSYPYSFQKYVGTPVFVDLWNNLGPLNSKESNVLPALTNMFNSGLLNYIPSGMAVFIIDDNWATNTFTNWNTGYLPNGFTNIVKTAHAFGIKVLLYDEPAALTSAGQPGMNTNIELFADFCAANGLDGARIDFSQLATFSLDQKLSILRRFYNEFVSVTTNSTQPIIESAIQSGNPIYGFVQNPSSVASVPPGTSLIDGTDPAAIVTDIGNFTNLLNDINTHYYPGTTGRSCWNRGSININNNTSVFPNYTKAAFSFDAVSGWSLEVPSLGAGMNDSWVTNGFLPILEDPLRQPPTVLYNNSTNECWFRRLNDGSYAVMLLNCLTNSTITNGFSFASLGIVPVNQNVNVSDIWSYTNAVTSSGYYTSSIPAMGSILLRLYPNSMQPTISPLNKAIYPSTVLYSKVAMAVDGSSPFYWSSTVPMPNSGGVNGFIADLPVDSWATSVVATITWCWDGTTTPLTFTNRYIGIEYADVSNASDSQGRNYLGAFSPTQTFTNYLNYTTITMNYNVVNEPKVLEISNIQGPPTNTVGTLYFIKASLTEYGNPYQTPTMP